MPKGPRSTAGKSAKADSITAEEIVAFIAGVIAFINEVLPVITFWWRFTCLAFFLILVMDLCLRSRRARVHLPSPYARLFLSLAVFAVIGAILWNPMRKQYMQEHLPPSLPFIFGAPLGDNDSPLWIMMIKHYGPNPAYNCGLGVYDLDRKNIEHDWLVKHPNSSFPPPGLAGVSQKIMRIPEVDPLGASPNFQWTPLDPNGQHYTVSINCRDGEFEEGWEVARVNGILRTEINIKRAAPWIERNPQLEQLVFTCTDPDFSSAPLALSMPNVSPQVINPVGSRIIALTSRS